MPNEYLIYGIKGLLFIFLFLASYFLFSYLKNSNLIANGFKNFYEKAEADVEERKRLEKMQQVESGNTDKESFLLKLDKTITYSNIRKYVPFLNTGIFIFSLVIFSSLALILGTVLSDLSIGVALALAIILIYISIILFLSNKNYKQVEKNIVSFMNLVENYSKTNNDLIAILGKVYPYLEEPLRSNILEAYQLGRRTGNTDLALERLQNSVQHKYFREIIRNLTICSHYEANYEEIIEDSRSQLMEYLAGKEERAAMVRNARIELIILVATSAVVMYLMGSFIGQNVIAALRGTFIGEVILIYLIGILGAVAFNLIFMGRDKN